MEILIGYLIGWFIFSLSYYIYNVCINKDKSVNKKVHAWHAFWSGIISWFGIVFLTSLYIVFIIYEVNEWVENKLNSF